MATTTLERGAIAAMCTGLGLTVIATIVPYADHATTHLLANHIQAPAATPMFRAWHKLRADRTAHLTQLQRHRTRPTS